MIGLLIVITPGYVDAAVPPEGPRTGAGAGQPSQLTEIRKLRYLKTKYEEAWKTNTPADIEWIAKNMDELLTNNVTTKTLLRAKLTPALDKASENGDIKWIEAAGPLLKKYIFSDPAEYDALVNAMQAPQKAAEAQAIEAERKLKSTEKKRREIRAALKDGFENLLMKSKSEKEYAKYLADTYAEMTGLATPNEQANHKLLNQLVERAFNAQDFLAYLRDVIGSNEEILNIVGDEVKMLTSNLLYRIPRPYQDITQKEAAAAFVNASIKKDFGAMINIYRDLLNAENRAIAVNETYRMLESALKDHDTQAIVDLYEHFLKDSELKRKALQLLFSYFIDQVRPIEERLAKDEPIEPDESLIKLSAVFNDTAYVPEVLAALQRFTRANAIMSLDLLDEYQAAQVNHDVNALLQLRSRLIDAGISRDIINAQIISMGGQIPPEAVGPSHIPPVARPAEHRPIGREELSQALTRAMEQQAAESEQRIQERWNEARRKGDLGELVELRDEAVRAQVIDPVLKTPLDEDLAKAIIESIQ